jgi:hypothetical protein
MPRTPSKEQEKKSENQGENLKKRGENWVDV